MADLKNVQLIHPSCIVLMAVYNGALWLDEQINSVLIQNDVNIKIFISIDYSTDDSYLISKAWAARDSRVYVLSYGERFGGAAKNFFRLIKEVDISNIGLVAFCDQDDIWLPDKIKIAWNKISFDYYDAYSCNVIAFDKLKSTYLINKSYKPTTYDHFFEAAGPGCTYVFSGQVFKNIQNFLMTNYNACQDIALHDWLLYAYCRHAGYSWFIDSNPYLMYRQHEGNLIGANNNLRAFIRRFVMIKKGWYRDQVIKISRIVAPELADKFSSRIFIFKNISKVRRRFRDRIFLLLIVILGFY